MKKWIKSKTLLTAAVAAAVVLSSCTAEIYSAENLDTQLSEAFQEGPAVSNKIPNSPFGSAHDKILDKLIDMPENERELIEAILKAEAGSGLKDLKEILPEYRLIQITQSLGTWNSQ
ncbi:MAG: hypothetical protein K2O18_16725 [Oscillospiraceae bacterium]|nr:hypothetical protein [Oscillospiraceae bacterium]